MVFNLEPLEIVLDFERKKYRLGDTIDATVTLIPTRDVEIRTASLSLMGQVRRTEITPGRAMDFGDAQRDTGAVIRVPTDPMASQSLSTEVFYRTRIVSAKSLRKGDDSTYSVALRLDPELWNQQSLSREARELQQDANRGLSIGPWWLEARADVVLGLDAIARREIQVIVSLANLGSP